MIDTFLEIKNISSLRLLKDKYPALYEASLQRLSEAKIKLLAELLTYPDHHLLTERMLEFTKGPGKVSYSGGCFTAAQENARKKEYHPTILKEEEFCWYLQHLQANSLGYLEPIREIFIITGPHWVVGRIEIHQGKSELFILTPLLKSGANIKQEVYLTILTI